VKVDIEKIKDGISKTGFVHEYRVCEILEQNGWNVINNRYYLDDVQEINREIDVIAYKVSQVEEVLCYTTLIISCKKSESNIWSFLTKDIKEGDPNINFCPISNWSNDKVLRYMTDQEKIEERILKGTHRDNDLNFVYGINEHVFAFQQLHKKHYTPQNDKDIYNSIISSIKALEYEKNSLNERKNTQVIYNFNLLSIFDGEMIKVHLNGREEIIEEIDDIKYLNRHIVNKKENFYRVHFMKFSRLNEFINHFNKLHVWNCNIYQSLINEFYENMTSENTTEKIELLFSEFEEEVKWDIIFGITDYTLNKYGLKYDSQRQSFMVGVSEEKPPGEYLTIDEEDDIANIIAQDEKAVEAIRNALKKIYRYEGKTEIVPFYFIDLPF
jgi:hypothetical protein